MAQVLHLTGPVLVGPDDVRPQAWVVGGRITYAAPTGDHDVTTVPGWVLPGLVDAHSHIGLGAHGAVDDATAEQQALADRDAGALLLRDAGSPADTRWVRRPRRPARIVRAGRHIARTRRYIRNFAWEVEPDQLVAQVRPEARAGDGWVKLVGDWIDRDTGDLSPCWPADVLAEAIAAAHEEGARVTAHCFGEESLHDFAAAGTDCIEHACGLEPETDRAVRGPGDRHRPDPGQHRDLPADRRAGPREVPRLLPAMIALHERRYDDHRARPTTPASRSTSAPTPAARCRTGWSPTRSRTSRARGSRRPRRCRRDLGGPRWLGRPGAGGGRGRPTWSSTPTTRGARTAPRWPPRSLVVLRGPPTRLHPTGRERRGWAASHRSSRGPLTSRDIIGTLFDR